MPARNASTATAVATTNDLFAEVDPAQVSFSTRGRKFDQDTLKVAEALHTSQTSGKVFAFAVDGESEDERNKVIGKLRGKLGSAARACKNLYGQEIDFGSAFNSSDSKLYFGSKDAITALKRSSKS